MLPACVCVPCQRFMRPKKNDYIFIEGMPAVDEARPGKDHPADWKPYKLWAGDLYECEGCKAQIITGYAKHPIADVGLHDDFAERVAHFKPKTQINGY